MILVELPLFVLAVCLSLYSGYLLVLLVANWVLREKKGLRPPPRTKFMVVVPAYNEEIFLPRLLESLLGQEYPEDLFDVVVVADNCTDRTAEVASMGKTIVLERHDARLVGKGFAIRFAVDNLERSQWDALFVVDADSVVQRDGLAFLDASVQRGNRMIQCYNGVANPFESWFTLLMDVSRTLANEILEPAKEKLGLSSHLMGNGMCFHRDVLQKYGWGAFSVGEDWEYYALAILQGERIAFAREVRVYHQESSSLKQATPQRMRWSSGRFEIVFRYGFRLFLTGLAERNLLKMDASLPLVFPNPSLGANLTVMGLVVSFFLPEGTPQRLLLPWFSGLIGMHLVVFLAGILYTEKKCKHLLSLFMAPVFLAWKMGIDLLSAMGLGRKRWVRTERKL